MNTDRQKIVISIADYLRKVWKWMPVVLSWAVLCAALAFTAVSVVKEPVYTAPTKVYILSREVDGDYERLDMSDIQVSAQMTSDSMLMLKNEQAAERAIARLRSDTDLNLKMTAKELLKMVDISRADDSFIITISATSPDPYLACDIANIYRDTVVEELEQKLMVRGIQTIEEAVVPLEHSGRSAREYAAAGAALGLLSAALLLFIHYAAKDAKREPEDIAEV